MTDTRASAMCEKQILVPNSSFLYCSVSAARRGPRTFAHGLQEQCRRMDALPSSQRPNSYASLSSSFRTKQRRPTIMDSLAHSLPRYIPALQPTPRPRVDARIPPTQHDAKTDLDPTEWKPADLSDPDDDRGTQNVIPKKQTDHAHRPDHSASHPEALLYLSRNHHTAAHGRKSGISVVATLPSLSHASTATASSTSSSATDLSEAAYSPELILPAQVHVPATSVSNVGVEGLSLDGDNHLRYEKRAVRSRKIESAASGSLKKLLAGENEGRM